MFLRGCKNPKISRLGRLEKRNKLIVMRYYYYTRLRGYDRRDSLDILSNAEFFVDRRTIVNALAEYADYYNRLREERPDVFQMERMYPQFNWRGGQMNHLAKWRLFLN